MRRTSGAVGCLPGPRWGDVQRRSSPRQTGRAPCPRRFSIRVDGVQPQLAQDDDRAPRSMDPPSPVPVPVDVLLIPPVRVLVITGRIQAGSCGPQTAAAGADGASGSPDPVAEAHKSLHSVRVRRTVRAVDLL